MKRITGTDKGRVIPKRFFVVTPFGAHSSEAKAVTDISKGVLRGVKGISDKAEIIMQWFGVARDAVLAMDGPELVRLNKLSRVQYDNPDYLVSNGLDALYRIFAKNREEKYGPQGLAGNLAEYIGIGIKKAFKEEGLQAEALQLSKDLTAASLAIDEAAAKLPEDEDDRKAILRQAEVDEGDLRFLDKRLRKASEYTELFSEYKTREGVTQRVVDLYLDPSDYFVHSFKDFRKERQRFLEDAEYYGFNPDQLLAFDGLLDAIHKALDTIDRIGDLKAKATEFITKKSRHAGIAYYAERGDLREVLQEAFQHTRNINTVRGLARLVAQAAQKSKNLNDVTLEDWDELIRNGLKHVGAVYGNEGEWLVKDETLRIPPGSQLWISKIVLPPDVEARRIAGETTKLDGFSYGYAIKSNDDVDKTIDDNNLKHKYKLSRIDKKKFDEARQKWYIKRHK